MEPMTLGSPTTQHQHSPANQSGVLPGFLLGEPSHQQRTNTFSPTKKTLSFVTSPQSGIHHNMYASPPSSTHQDSMNPRSPFNQSGMGQQQQLQQTKLFKYHPTSHDNSINAPPAVDLFDSLRDERSSPPKAQGMNVTSPFHQSQQHTLQQSQFGESYMDNSGFNVLRVMSPIQNASMHENRSKAPFNSFWVTVFGFPPSSVATILSHFAQCGTIVDKMFSPQNGNWIHLRFSSRIECDKALNYNGKIIANGLMIGVVQCTDQSIINEDVLREDRENITKMRPLSRVTYDTTQSPTKVDPQVFAPKMNNGIVSKALDMFFGW